MQIQYLKSVSSTAVVFPNSGGDVLVPINILFPDSGFKMDEPPPLHEIYPSNLHNFELEFLETT